MLRKWLLCGVIVAAGAVTWNEYRLWSHRSTPAPMQVAEAPAEELVTAAKGAFSEEECDAVVIDLSILQKQTNEPAIADTEEPAAASIVLGVGVNSGAGLTGTIVEVPAQFQKHSADGDCCAAKGNLAETCKKLTCWIWGTSPHDGAEAAELLYVMPRLSESNYHHDHPGCPYTGGCPYDGSAYRRSAPAAGPTGDETQDAPPTKPKADQRKQPKLDTMEVRPGDVSPSWFCKPF